MIRRRSIVLTPDVSFFDEQFTHGSKINNLHPAPKIMQNPLAQLKWSKHETQYAKNVPDMCTGLLKRADMS